MNINADAAQSGVELLDQKVRYVQFQNCSLDKGQRDL